MNVQKWRMSDNKEDILIVINMKKREMLEFIKNALDKLETHDEFILEIQLIKNGDKKN